MKKLNLLLLLFLATVALHGQTFPTATNEPVTKVKSTGELTAGFSLKSGDTIEAKTGSTFTLNGTLGGTPTGGTLDLSGVNVTLANLDLTARYLEGDWTADNIEATALLAGSLRAEFDFYIPKRADPGITEETYFWLSSTTANRIKYGGTGGTIYTLLATADIGTSVLAPNGNGSQLTALNASQLTTGTVPVARIPTTISQATTFAAVADGSGASRLTISGNSGRLYLTDVDAGANSRNWVLGYSEASEGDLLLRVSAAASGDPVAGITALAFDRTGAATFNVGLTLTQTGANKGITTSATNNTGNHWTLRNAGSATDIWSIYLNGANSMVWGSSSLTSAYIFGNTGALTTAGQFTASGTGRTMLAAVSSNVSDTILEINNTSTGGKSWQFRSHGSSASGPLAVADFSIFTDAAFNGHAVIIKGSDGRVILNSTASSSSTTTGALTVAGGLGVAGAGYLGGSMHLVSGNTRLNFNRSATNAYSGTSWFTSGAEQWFFGLRETGTANLFLYNPNTSANAVTFSRSDSSTAFHSTTGSTSTTTGALVVGSNVGLSGNAGGPSYFGGAVMAQRDVNGSFDSFFTNTSAGSVAEANFGLSNAGSLASSTFIQVGGTGLTAAGGFFQDGGAVGTGTLLSGGLSIMARAASSDVRIYAGSHSNLVATFFSTGATRLTGTLATAANIAWDLGAYTGGAAPTPDGYLTVTVAGATYRISADLQ